MNIRLSVWLVFLFLSAVVAVPTWIWPDDVNSGDDSEGGPACAIFGLFLVVVMLFARTLASAVERAEDRIARNAVVPPPPARSVHNPAARRSRLK